MMFSTWYVILSSIFLLLWLLCTLWGIRTNRDAGYWSSLLVLAILTPYLIYLPFLERPYGFDADSDTLAFVGLSQSAANGYGLEDFNYYDLPVYYSPLWFVCAGLVSKIMQISVLDFYKFLPIVSLLLLAFLIIKIGDQFGGRGTGVLFLFAYFLIGGFEATYLMGGSYNHYFLHLAIYHPHDSIAAVLLLWGIITFVYYPGMGGAIRAGLLGGIVTWLSVADLPLYLLCLSTYSIFELVRKRRIDSLIRLATIIALVLIIASPYMVPLLRAAMQYGTDRYQLSWTFHGYFDPTWSTIGMGFFGLTFFLGLIGMARLENPSLKFMLVLSTVMLYVIAFSILVTKPLFNISFLPAKARDVLFTLLSFTTALTLRDLPLSLQFLRLKITRIRIGYLFLLFTFALPLLAWNPLRDPYIEISRTPIPKEVQNVARVIKTSSRPRDVILSTCTMSWWIPALTGRKLALAGEPWYSNPVARYDLRYADFQRAFVSNDPGETLGILDKWRVDILVFEKGGEYWYFAAKIPENSMFHPGGTSKMRVDARRFTDLNHFDKIFEDEKYQILRVKRSGR